MKDEVREELGVISELVSHWLMTKACRGVCGSMARRYVAVALSGHMKRLCGVIDCGSLGASVYGAIDALTRIGDELKEGGDVEDHLVERVIDEFVNTLPLIERELLIRSGGGAASDSSSR